MNKYYSRDSVQQDFEQWCEQHQEEIDIELAESGADRELDFDSEREYEIRYEKYLNE